MSCHLIFSTALHSGYKRFPREVKQPEQGCIVSGKARVQTRHTPPSQSLNCPQLLPSPLHHSTCFPRNLVDCLCQGYFAGFLPFLPKTHAFSLCMELCFVPAPVALTQAFSKCPPGAWQCVQQRFRCSYALFPTWQSWEITSSFLFPWLHASLLYTSLPS